MINRTVYYFVNKINQLQSLSIKSSLHRSRRSRLHFFKVIFKCNGKKGCQPRCLPQPLISATETYNVD